MQLLSGSACDIERKSFGDFCTPTSSCLLPGCDDSRDSHELLYFSGAEPSTVERSHLTSSCSTHAYFPELLSPSSLNCDESLASPCEDEDSILLGTSPRQLGFERSNSAPLPTSSVYRDNIARMIGNEANRQWQVRPSCSYLEKHPITENMRSVAVRWLVEVTSACNLKATTLVLAVSYFDRFLSVAEDVAACMLQLIAVASLSLAAKQEEVLQPTAAEWTAISDHSFTVTDLVRMEWVVFHHLSWRGRTPTALVFLNLFCCGLDIISIDLTKAAQHFVEISILDFNLLQHDYSTIAASALVIVHQINNLHFDMQDLLTIAPFLSSTDVTSCANALWKQHLISTGSA